MCATTVVVALVVAPSPKSQNRLVVVPDEPSVKVTVKGTTPEVGPAVKAATGTAAAWPLTRLVAPPPLLVNTSALVKAPAATGLNLTRTLVALNPPTVKLEPRTTLNGGLTLAAPPVTLAPPEFVTTKACWALVPKAIHPKSQLAVVTASCAGVRPTPVTAFVELPPLLVKVTFVAKVPAWAGLKATRTRLVEPAATEKEPLLTTLKGGELVAVPLSVLPPRFAT